ncbi:XRE family transcriptional regulator [Desulfobacter postgatei]|uniref:helix-turn-helix domain-containing protein n=1 Tax=Desulfobacter postgatei TaxID=2293 RepID=UPI00259B7654|nr:XRE family transcriptional regulator [uncultured Desulfobacter sp.]
MNETYKNVFSALEDDPAEARNLFIRSKLMLEIKKQIKETGMTQKAAGTKMGVTQPRISDLMQGKIDLFTIDALVSMLEKIGVEVEVSVKPAVVAA